MLRHRRVKNDLYLLPNVELNSKLINSLSPETLKQLQKQKNIVIHVSIETDFLNRTLIAE